MYERCAELMIQEDFKAMAGVQRGMASGVLDHTTIGANEAALARFHDFLAIHVEGSDPRV